MESFAFEPQDFGLITINRKNGDPVKIYAETFEHEAYDQIKRLAN